MIRANYVPDYLLWLADGRFRQDYFYPTFFSIKISLLQIYYKFVSWNRPTWINVQACVHCVAVVKFFDRVLNLLMLASLGLRSSSFYPTRRGGKRP
jgi:hypothetical protein